jgi:hypothetical protein
MKTLHNALLFAAMAAPICAQAAPYDVRLQREAGAELNLTLSYGQPGAPFVGVLIAATKDSLMEIPGLPPLLAFEAIVASAVAIDEAKFSFGIVKLPYEVWLQGVTLSDNGAAVSQTMSLPAVQ